MINDVKPTAEDTIWKCLDDQHREHWEAGLMHQYSKNADGKLLSRPIPIESKPAESKLYQSIIACRTKEKGKDLYKFETRHCVNGGPMEQGKDFDFSHSPTIGYCPLRIVLAFTASTGRQLFAIDVSNCFQQKIIPPNLRRFLTGDKSYHIFI